MANTKTQNLFYAKSQYTEAGGCFSIAFFRPTLAADGTTATSNVRVNGIPIEAGQTLTIAQNVGDQDWSSYEVVFYPSGGSENELYAIKIVPEGNNPEFQVR